jgi:hypothetical protein
MLLEGVDPTEHIDHFPLVDKLVQNVRTITTAGEARLRVFVLLTFVAGFATTSDFMAEAIGLTTSERERTSARARTTAVAIVTPRGRRSLLGGWCFSVGKARVLGVDRKEWWV